MKRNGRRIETFEPCGPIAAMIDNETRNKPRGAKVTLFEMALANFLGPKYPKQLQRFQALREAETENEVAA